MNKLTKGEKTDFLLLIKSLRIDATHDRLGEEAPKPPSASEDAKNQAEAGNLRVLPYSELKRRITNAVLDGQYLSKECLCVPSKERTDKLKAREKYLKNYEDLNATLLAATDLIRKKIRFNQFTPEEKFEDLLEEVKSIHRKVARAWKPSKS